MIENTVCTVLNHYAYGESPKFTKTNMCVSVCLLCLSDWLILLSYQWSMTLLCPISRSPDICLLILTCHRWKIWISSSLWKKYFYNSLINHCDITENPVIQELPLDTLMIISSSPVCWVSGLHHINIWKSYPFVLTAFTTDFPELFTISGRSSLDVKPKLLRGCFLKTNIDFGCFIYQLFLQCLFPFTPGT